MKKWLLLLFLLPAFSAFSQKQKISSTDQKFLDEQKELNEKRPDCGCFIKVPLTHIGKRKAGKRFQRYDDKTARCGLDQLAKRVSYSPKGAKDLLDSLTVKGYNGFRAYFAVYPSERKSMSDPDSGYNYVPYDQGGKFTLIYVPTKRQKKKLRRHPDDTTHCMIIKDDKAIKISATIASLWIRAAEDRVLSTLEKDAQCDHPNFQEAYSLWFSNIPVRHNPALNGLLDILQCRMCTESVTRVDANFGAFLKVPVFRKNDYKLTVVFTLVNGDSPNFISLYAGDALGTILEATTSGSDTGKPCPPPPNCNTGRGALLPVQP